MSIGARPRHTLAFLLALVLAGIPLLGAQRPARAALPDVVLAAPYLAEGGTGPDSVFNCGPAVVAAAITFSGVAAPSVEDVRAALGHNGPTNLGEWAALLAAYGAPYVDTWSRDELESSLRAGRAVVVAVWMSDLSFGPDVNDPGAWPDGQTGRYVDYGAGHALLIVGIADGGTNYLVHDPNVFGGGGASPYQYADGSPKGEYRRYNADELWASIARYAGGHGLAVAPPPPPAVSKPMPARPALVPHLVGPGGGRPPRRGGAAAVVETTSRTRS